MTTVVIMAGGRGLRLHPLTEHTPKPMLQVGRHPILHQIIDDFARQGFTEFVLCLGYKAEIIKEYFGNGSSIGVSIKYVVEREPLGTAGALRLIPRQDNPVIVINADVIARVNYADLIRAHHAGGRLATACLALHQHQVPYGVVDIKDGDICTISEKPIMTWTVAAGIYVLSPDALALIPEGYSDMPDHLDRIAPVATYQIDDYWVDVGRFEDLSRARAAQPS